MFDAGLGLVLLITGIYGAINYKKWAVMLSAVVHVVATVTATRPINLVLPILFLYPHVVLIIQIHNEVMTPYNPADTNTKAELVAEDRHTKPLSIAADHRRENHLICGCCCDSRRATIVVNIVNVVIDLLNLLGGAWLMMDKNNGAVLNMEISPDDLFFGWLVTVWHSSCIQLESMVLSIIRNGLYWYPRSDMFRPCLPTI
jgi:hypothetical protein